MELEFHERASRPVEVDPDELVRAGNQLRDLAGRLSRELPTAADLTASPAGWSVRYALVRLVHEVNGHLTAISSEVTGLGERLRAAGVEYTEADTMAADRLARTVGTSGGHR